MNMNSKKKMIVYLAATLFVVTGTYNALVINSESHISSSETRFVKRLDEILGVTIPGREVASVNWKKLQPTQVVAKNELKAEIQAPVVSTPVIAPVQESAVVEDELSLHLVEVINPEKWKDGVPAGQFSGSLQSSQGVIENLTVTLPGGEGITVSFSEMSGNVFEYDLNGEQYAGMMYQVDKNAYMVTLTNGPFEGTRLRFSSLDPALQQQENMELLANNNVEVGSFGQEQVNPELMMNDELTVQEETLQAQGFNFQNTEAL